jgi:hypothetical protein
MESWNSVINVALLGTEKRSLKTEEVDPVFAESFALVQEQGSSSEDAFLQRATLVYNYRQCGFLPLHKETVSVVQAEAEERAYASPLAHAVLSDVLESGSISLLFFWLEQCSRNHLVVQPDFLPVLLNLGIKKKELHPLLNTCCGRRGEWLRQFNREWKKGETLTEEESWQTGTLAQRKALLAGVREQNPARGRELLQQTWAQEPAATRAELLETLLINASEEDLPWLEEVQNEKSVKVKEVALQVLKGIPGSAIVQSYWRILQQSVWVNTAKGILGIGSKTSLEIKLASVDPAIFKTGIQQLSDKAKTSDEDFILYQLMTAVPPRFWELHFNLDKKKILDLFAKEERTAALAPAFGLAASRFRDIEWLRAVISVDQLRLYGDAFELFPQKEAEQYALAFLDEDLSAAGVLSSIHHFKEEWSLDFTRAILHFTAKNPYQYTRSFYNDMASVLPAAIATELENCSPKEAYLRSMWTNLSDHIIRLLTLKQQTLKAFQEQPINI